MHRTIPRTLRALGMLAALVALGATQARAYDAANDFSPTLNTAGRPWTYGWTPTRGGTFTLFPTHGTDGTGLQYWTDAGSGTRLSYNPTGGAVAQLNSTTLPSLSLSLLPGTTTQYTVVRWTAPFTDSFEVAARFLARSPLDFSKDVAVLQGSAVLFSHWLNPLRSASSASMSAALALNAGETVDFVVGPADGSNAADYVSLDATVTPLPPALGPAGPVFAIGSQRFMPSSWPAPAFESIAFDPVNQRVASNGKIYDLCGNEVSAGPDEQPGLAWDPVTLTYWQITNDRVVRRWNGATLLDTVFTIPPTFTVPGTGLDTLDSVRGIAVDSSYVYVVDAGPNPGQPESNAWFKFDRAGNPVKCSKSTDLLAHLEPDPDALVDDIVYSPYSSPLFPGKLLVALEHSGIQVLDTDGNFVEKFRWSTQGLTPADAFKLHGRVTAFAGLALDPVTGNLYLANNDGLNQVWARIAPQGPTFAALGTLNSTTAGVGAVLQYPNPGCNQPTIEPLVPTGGPPVSNFFGIAYRPVDHAVYACEFGYGELWKFDARVGNGVRVGPTGVPSIWGMAYDTQRDVLYGGMEGSGSIRIVVIDPATGDATPLPGSSAYYTTDLAFDSADGKIYGVANGAPGPRLIRIDRDTGLGTVVGNTVTCDGLDYDAASGKLIGLSQQSNFKLYRIDPATGAAESLAVLPQNRSFEGLAVVPIPASPSLVSVEPHDRLTTTGLRVWPNPTGGGMTVAFDLPASAQVEVGVFDVAGRLVRKLRSGSLGAGPQRVAWDGRDGAGGAAPSGVYFVRVSDGARTRVARLVRAR